MREGTGFSTVCALLFPGYHGNSATNYMRSRSGKRNPIPLNACTASGLEHDSS